MFGLRVTHTAAYFLCIARMKLEVRFKHATIELEDVTCFLGSI